MNGSRNERWLETKITGPLDGMCSRPIRDSRQYNRATICSGARVSQYTIGLTPFVRARACQSVGFIPVAPVPGDAYTAAGRGVTVNPMALDVTRTLRGALAGAA